VIAVTCFSEKGYEETGKKMLETFVENWPCKIIAYYEGKLPDFRHEKIIYRPFFSIPGVLGFLDFLVNCGDPRINGVVIQNGKEVYNYNYDIWKFCKKMFAQFDAFEEGGVVFWVDADVVTKKKIPEEFLENLFDDEALVFLGRQGFHTETGFVGFDTEHEDFDEFFERYKDSLRRGIIFTLPRWHDCEAFDWAREGKGKDLSPFWRDGDPLGVWEKTILYDYMVHFKGQRKYIVNDDEKLAQAVKKKRVPVGKFRSSK